MLVGPYNLYGGVHVRGYHHITHKSTVHCLPLVSPYILNGEAPLIHFVWGKHCGVSPHTFCMINGHYAYILSSGGVEGPLLIFENGKHREEKRRNRVVANRRLQGTAFK